MSNTDYSVASIQYKLIITKLINQNQMKKLLIFCALFVTIIQGTNANEESVFRAGTVSGTVIDKGLNQPLPYVNIEIKNGII